MENKFLGVVVLVSAVLVSGAVFFTPNNVTVNVPKQDVVFGGANGTEHTQVENFYAGLTVGEQASPTVVTRRQCGTAVKNLASIAPGGTSTIDIAVTGATSSQNQAYSVGVNTSTIALPNFSILGAFPSSTTGFVTMLVGVTTGTTALDLGTSTFSACYVQF